MELASTSALAQHYGSAINSGRSWVLRGYAALAVLLSAFVVLLVVLALPGWIARAVDTSATLMLAPGLLVLVGLALVVAWYAPVYLAVRRCPTPGTARGLERVYGLCGFGIIIGVYIGLLIAVPPAEQTTPPAAIAPLVEVLYGMPPAAGIVPPLVAMVALIAIDRIYRT